MFRETLPGVFLVGALLLVIPSLNQCRSMQNKEMITQPMAVRSIDSLSAGDRVIQAHFTVGTPTPCWHHAETEVDVNGKEIYVKVFAEVEKDITCIQVLGSYETTTRIELNEPGEYTMHVWQSESTSLDTTISVQ